MKQYFIILLSILLMLACSDSEETMYVQTEKDNLKFLASEAEIIAIVKTIEGAEKGTIGAKDFSFKEIEAVIIQVLKGPLKTGETIVISNKPFYSEEGSILHVTRMSRDTRYLSFLKEEKESKKYKPVTGVSSSVVYGDDRINPIWSQSDPKGVSLDVALRKIEEIIEK